MSTLLTLTPETYLYRSPLSLDALSLDISTAGPLHPNKAPFRGILTRIDEASTRAPSGSQGHRVLIPRAVADAALPSLQGMPINFSVTADGHDYHRVVGVIEEATIDGQDLVVSGYLLEKNWPTEVSEIRRDKAVLGMSYELSGVEVADTQAPIWTLTHLVFTGAAILRKQAAAYHQTAIAATTERTMDEHVLQQLETLTVKMDLLASHDAEADLAAARQAADEAEALAAQAQHAARQAQLARADADEAEARTYAAEAETKHQAATRKRTAAIARYESLATRCTEAGDAEAATQHTQAATRLKEADATQEATIAAMQASPARETPARETPPAADEQRYATLFGMFVKAMREAQTVDPAPLAATSTPPAPASGGDVQTKRTLRRLEASVELLTDTVSKMAGLLTDVVANQRSLATDRARGNNGGPVPVRKTLAGTAGDVWLQKGPTDDQAGKLTADEINAQAKADGLGDDDARRMARVLEASRRGTLKV